jgi:hypothetical protein
VTQTVTHTNPRAGFVAPGDYTIDLAQGWAWYFGSIGLTRHVKKCVNTFLGICIDNRWYIEFATFNVRSSVAPVGSGEAHFSGAVSKTNDVDDGDGDCRDLANCPTSICYPGQCPRP